MQDVALHENFEKVESVLPRSGKSLLVRPVIVVDAIAGDDHAGPVIAAAAMHEDWGLGRIFENGENFRHLAVVRLPNPREAHAVVLHAYRLHLFFFMRLMNDAPSQIEHGLDPHLLQLRITLGRRLMSGVNVIIDTPEPCDIDLSRCANSHEQRAKELRHSYGAKEHFGVH